MEYIFLVVSQFIYRSTITPSTLPKQKKMLTIYSTAIAALLFLAASPTTSFALNSEEAAWKAWNILMPFEFSTLH